MILKTITKGITMFLFPLLLMSCDSNKQKLFPDIKGKAASVKETKYDAAEKFGEAIPKHLLIVQLYNFDKAGNLLDMLTYNEEGKEVMRQVQTYENGKCIEIHYKQDFYTKYESTQKLISRTKESEVWKVSYVNGDPDGIVEVKYEDSGRKKVRITKNEEGDISNVIEEIFDKKGNLIEVKNSDKDEVIFWEKNTYDNENRIIEKKQIAGYNEGIITYKYQGVDKNGNWTEKMEYENSELSILTKREIQYY